MATGKIEELLLRDMFLAARREVVEHLMVRQAAGQQPVDAEIDVRIEAEVEHPRVAGAVAVHRQNEAVIRAVGGHVKDAVCDPADGV